MHIYRIAVWRTTTTVTIISCCLRAEPSSAPTAPRDRFYWLVHVRVFTIFVFNIIGRRLLPFATSLWTTHEDSPVRHSNIILIIRPQQVGPRDHLHTAVVIDDAIVSLFVDLCHDGVGGSGGGGSGSNTPRINTRPRRRG